MNQTILNLWQENGTFSMINQMQIMMYAITLSIIQKFQKSNLYDYNNAYILVKYNINVTVALAA